MAIDPAAELARFQEFLAAHVKQGDSLSPEEALDLWRLQNPDPNEFADNVAAVREALADIDAGDQGVPFEEFDREFRRRHRIT
jgi:hypothetical protein